MTIIELTTYINAPIEQVFDLARSIDLHTQSMAHTGELAIGGRTSGLIEMGETVTWRARHFGRWQTLTSKITEYNYPHYFTDEMVEGAFESFTHQHLFYAINSQTVMKDIFIYQSPHGKWGQLADFLFLGRYMTSLLKKRNKAIKKAAEAN